MKALWFESGVASWRELETPLPGPNEALLKLRVAGICRTDQELLAGYMQFRGVPGHEFVAEVVQCDSQPQWVGKRVVGDINCGCGVCRFCRAGNPNHCPTRTVLGISGRQGCFAEYFTLPAANLHAIPHGVQDFDAVFAEPLAAACRILEQVTPERALVVGDGKLGILVAMALRKAGAKVYLRGHHDARMEFLKTLPIHRDTGASFPLVVDCTGNPKVLDSLLNRVDPRGTLVMKSTYGALPTFDLTRVVVNEITLVGSRCGPFPEALQLLCDSEVSQVLSKVRERVFPFSKSLEALQVVQQGNVIKVILDCLETAPRSRSG